MKSPSHSKNPQSEENQPDNKTFQQKADDLLNTSASPGDQSTYPLSEKETRKLIRELQVQRIEFDMQSAELKLAKEALQESERKFRALFEKGPIGVACHEMIYDVSGKPVDYPFLDANERFRELTERRKVEDALKESELKYRSLIENSSDAVFCVDEKGEYKFTNHLFASTFGKTPEYFIGKTFWDVYDKEHADSRYEVTKRVFQTGESESLEVEVPLPDRTLFFLATANPIKDETGKVILNLTHATDITELKKTQKALSESHQFNTQIINSEQEGIIVFDCDLRYQVWNPFMERLTGAPASQVIGKHISELFPFLQDAGVTGKVKAALFGEDVSDGDFPFQLHDSRKSGWSSYKISPLKDAGDQIIGVIVNVHDITVRKLAEDALRESEEKYRTLIENLPSGLVVHGLDTSILASNLMASSILGLTRDQLFGKTAMDPNWHFIQADGLLMPLNEYPVNRVLASGEGFNNLVIGRPDNDSAGYIWALCNAYPIRRKDGPIMQVVVTFNDITKLKQTEQELVIAKERAEQSDRLKSAFLANMSHEIRTPMNGILGFASLLKEPDLSGQEQQQFIRMIERSGARMLNIINDIVDISKIESGQMEVSISETNVNDQIEFIYNFFIPEVTRKNLQFSFRNSLPAKESIINTDREKIFAILSNLVKNAIKFTNEGSIEFGYDIEIAETDNVAETDNYLSLRYFRFFVKDTGIGIPPQKLAIIFERFAQVDVFDTKALQGAGLGLSISRAYVEMLGGKIWVESNEGKGSVFYFSIPVNSSQKETPVIDKVALDTPVDEVSDQIKKLKILIAEDDEASEFFITSIVKKISKEVLYTSSGIDAIEISRNNPDIDLILMDIQLPEMNGYEATRQIRGFNKGVIIIAQTAFALTGEREKAIEAGCNDYISKPIKKDELRNLIQKYFC